MSKQNRNIILDRVTSTIVYEMEHVGIFHYNKLTYLFEYFYIKNFGERFSNEYFPKYPHGPVISNYPKQISTLINDSIFDGDINDIKIMRPMDDFDYRKKTLKKNSSTQNNIVMNKLARLLLVKIINRFGHLTCSELEDVAYKTKPVINYLKEVDAGFKKQTGGYVLKGSTIKIKEGKKSFSEGMKIAFAHMKKYSHVDYEQLSKDAEEFSFLEKYRPTYAEINESADI